MTIKEFFELEFEQQCFTYLNTTIGDENIVFEEDETRLLYYYTKTNVKRGFRSFYPSKNFIFYIDYDKKSKKFKRFNCTKSSELIKLYEKIPKDSFLQEIRSINLYNSKSFVRMLIAGKLKNLSDLIDYHLKYKCKAKIPKEIITEWLQSRKITNIRNIFDDIIVFIQFYGKVKDKNSKNIIELFNLLPGGFDDRYYFTFFCKKDFLTIDNIKDHVKYYQSEKNKATTF